MERIFKIGVFDSGIGGVTVLKEIIKILPNLNYYYYSDSINNPYGEKTDKEVIDIADNIIRNLIDNGAQAIVIACNTASAKAASFLREKYNNIPIIAIEPAYKMVYDYAYDDITLVMATKGTIESEKFNLLYQKYNNNKTILLPCSGLADIIEEGNHEKIQKYLKQNLQEYTGKVKNVVLGCTHYPLIKDDIKKILGNVKFFDGAERVAKHLKEILKKNGNCLNGNGVIEFYDSQELESKKDRFFKILKKE